MKIDINAIAEAYGHLWHVVTKDAKVHKARILLRDLLNDQEKRSGIEKAKQNASGVDDREIMRVDD